MSSSVDIKSELNDCGCCEGISVETPTSVVNRPGLSALAYRVGTHSQFKETLLARLSASGQPALRDLTTRDDDDFLIALLDAWATVGDVLTFYQERIANEAYLRTATERFSVMELARLINYQLSPGVAASTYLAFTLEDAPGALGQVLTAGTTAQLAPSTLPPMILDVGIKVQSVPGPGESAQLFETVEKIEARPEWNALRPQTQKLIPPAFGDQVVYLKGSSSNLKPGDMLLFVGEERLADRASDRWDVRRVFSVEIQGPADRTKVRLEHALGSEQPRRDPPANARVFVLRQRASIFGYNAPDWRTLPNTMKANYLGFDDPKELIDGILVQRRSNAQTGGLVQQGFALQQSNLTEPYSEKREWPGFTIFAPSQTTESLPSPDREIPPTRESVAEAAVSAAEAGAKAAAGNATKAASDAAKAASDAANQVAESGRRIVEATAKFTENLVTRIPQKTIDAAKQSFQDAVSISDEVRTLVLTVGNQIGTPALDANDTPNSAASKFRQHVSSRATSLATDANLNNAIVNKTAAALVNAANAAAAATMEVVNLAREQAHATGPELNQLAQTARHFAQSANQAAESAVGAVTATQVAILATALIKAVNELLPDDLKPADANAMAEVSKGIAEESYKATLTGDAIALTSVAGLAAGAYPILLPVGAAIMAGGVVGTPAAMVGAAKVRDAIKAAANAANRSQFFPRPQRRDIFAKSKDTIDLDATYSKITSKSWLVLALPADPSAQADDPPADYQRLYQVTRVTEASRSDFTLTAKVTRITVDGIDLDKFQSAVRTTTVFAESEELPLAETPLTDPVWKQEVVLDRVVDGLQPGRKVIVTGKLLRRIRFTSSLKQKLPGGDFLLLEPPLESDKSFNRLRWHVSTLDGTVSFVEAPHDAVTYVTTNYDSKKVFSELVVLDHVTTADDRTRLVFTTPLTNVYDAATVVISANVALGTHGETTTEVLGGGDAKQAFQRFVLKQPPLTYVSSSDPSGAKTTLEVRVNNVLWHEVPDFFAHEPDERIYVTRLSDDGKTTVIFGDGETGARLPSGQENITAKYRKGIGAGGLVRADQLTQLLSRPLGLKDVTNPIAAAGAADAENVEEVRRNAPLTVLTLGRVVSIKDYEDFANGFGGIGKALATKTWFGEVGGVFLTVAGIQGAAIDEQSTLFQNLLTALRSSGDPLVALSVKSYQPRFFSLRASITVDPDLLPDKVKAEVEQKVRDAFSFDKRDFGQPVHLSELISVMQNVTGVTSVDVDSFYRSDQSADRLSRIAAAAPQLNGAGVAPAELLLIDPNGIQVEVTP